LAQDLFILASCNESLLSGVMVDAHVSRMQQGRAARSSERDRRFRQGLESCEGGGSFFGNGMTPAKARQMLVDFENVGVDEDLEMLRSSWRKPDKESQSQRLGASALAWEPRPSRVAGSSALSYNSEQRLRTLAALRTVATHSHDHNPLMLGDSAPPPSAASVCYSVQLSGGFGRHSRRDCEWTAQEADAWDVWARRWEEELRAVDRLQQGAHGCAAAAKSRLDRKRPDDYRQRVEQPVNEQAKRSCLWQPTFSCPTAPRSTAAPPVVRESRATASPVQQFDVWEQQWEQFERSSTASSIVSAADIPWPPAGMTVSGIAHCDNGQQRKAKLKKALLRWHPDKWHTVVQKIPASQQSQVLERVKAVAQLVLEEKNRF